VIVCFVDIGGIDYQLSFHNEFLIGLCFSASLI